MRLVSNGVAIDIDDGDTVLITQLRAGQFPPGSLCLTGDCGNCLATVDGMPYTRTCQTPARPGMVVVSHAADREPPLPSRTVGTEPTVRHRHERLVVIGGDPAAPRKKRRAVRFDPATGDRVVGVYPGRRVVTVEDDVVNVIDAERVVVATERMDIHPVCPGSRLSGILTPSAARSLAATDVDLGRVVAVGDPVEGFEDRRVDGRLVRFEGRGRVEAVVVVGDDGTETVHPCDTVVVNLGTVSRDMFGRMGAPEVETVGTMTEPDEVPALPDQGVVCPCSDVSMSDLAGVADRGFVELELLKRATLAGTGTCQGRACLPYLRSFVAQRTAAPRPAPFTARPVGVQPTMGEIAAGWHPPAFRRTTIDPAHRAAGAVMDRFGGWWRPWHYGDVTAEYWAVREAVSIGDVSTLGKLVVAGPDTESFLDRIYPVPVSDLSDGRSRYVLVLDEAGYVIDDGLVCRDEDRFYLTFTTGGASAAEAWLRDWADTWEADVRILDRTASLGAINVTGPLATDLLERMGATDLPRFMRHDRGEIADVPCRVLRLSFTGEVSYELHHPVDRSAELWKALIETGRDLGIKPHGLDALFTLRLEKGHILIGMDTEPDSTPKRLGMEWAAEVDPDRSAGRDYVGREGVVRTSAIPPDRTLVGLAMDGRPPPEGSIIRLGGSVAGHVTSSRWSPVLGHTVMLGWVRTDRATPSVVEVDDDEALIVDTPFFDPSGERARV